MTQLTDEHFELHTKNKAEQFERQKIKFLEDRIATLEKSVERLHKIVGTMDRYKEDNNEADFVHSQGFSLKEKS
jgi:cob(I)alamin adenosyltransferase